ncbi:hypothetical protein ECG_00932 [Echinococcus granulosus]|nr:hypothetical protein ECG_00932 [Echinococcus granulosus]
MVLLLSSRVGMASEEDIRRLKIEMRSLKARHNSLLRFISNMNEKLNQHLKKCETMTRSVSMPCEVSDISIADLTPPISLFHPVEEASEMSSADRAEISPHDPSTSQMFANNENKEHRKVKSSKRHRKRRRMRHVKPTKKQLMRVLRELEP